MPSFRFLTCKVGITVPTSWAVTRIPQADVHKVCGLVLASVSAQQYWLLLLFCPHTLTATAPTGTFRCVSAGSHQDLYRLCVQTQVIGIC